MRRPHLEAMPQPETEPHLMREESIFAGALEIATGRERTEYLNRACAGDAELRRRWKPCCLPTRHRATCSMPPREGLHAGRPP